MPVLDRLDWTRRMTGKGYLPKAQFSTDESQANRMAFELKKSRTKLRVFRQFSAPIYVRILEGEIKAAEAILSFQDERLQRHQDRLDYVKRQIVAARSVPHDGFAIYANEEGRNIHIEPGMIVRQKQRLF